MNKLDNFVYSCVDATIVHFSVRISTNTHAQVHVKLPKFVVHVIFYLCMQNFICFSAHFQSKILVVHVTFIF